MSLRDWVSCVLFVASLPAVALAYPGGTPDFQTDVAPFCAGCHSSRSEAALTGAPGGRAQKELATSKHLALIESGEEGYKDLTPAQRAELVAHVKALDAASTIALEAPASVRAGETFEVTVKVTGGAGPVVGVGLVDLDHRWLARPAPSAGWQIAAPPEIAGPDGRAQTEWLSRRPESAGRSVSFVNVTGIESDASKRSFASARVTWRLRAPSSPGAYPLAAAYWYGTEKGSPLGYTTDPVRGRQVRGGFTGHSGRLLFTSVQRIDVK